MYFIQEQGQVSGNARADYKMFYCDYATDIAKLPTQTTKGKQSTGNRVLDDTYNDYCKPGDQCMCLENSKVFTLRWEPNDWKEM